jgi:hypothetical protein
MTTINKNKLFSFTTSSLAILFSVMILVLFTSTVSNDAAQYDLIFDAIKKSESLWDAIISLRYEPGFTSIYYFLSFLDSRVAFILLGSLSLIIKYIIFRKYLPTIIFPWLCYIIIFMPALEASQIRSAVASILILYVVCTTNISNNYIFKGVAASLLHMVGVLIFAYQFVKKPFIAILLIIFAAFALNIFFQLLISYFPVLYYYRANQFGEVNLFSTIFLSQLLISTCCVLNWRLFNFTQKKGAFLIIIGTVLFISLSDFSSVVHRVREISMLGIFPILFHQQLRLTFPSLTIYIAFGYYLVYHLFFLSDELLTYI